MPGNWFDDITDDLFAKPVPKKRKASRRQNASMPGDWFDSVFALQTTPTKHKKSVAKPHDPYDFGGMADAYYGARRMVKMARDMRHHAERTPTDHDEIMRRAELIRARQRKERERAAALKVIEEDERENERQRTANRTSALDVIRRLLR